MFDLYRKNQRFVCVAGGNPPSRAYHLCTHMARNSPSKKHNSLCVLGTIQIPKRKQHFSKYVFFFKHGPEKPEKPEKPEIHEKPEKPEIMDFQAFRAF